MIDYWPIEADEPLTVGEVWAWNESDSNETN